MRSNTGDNLGLWIGKVAVDILRLETNHTHTGRVPWTLT